MLMSILAQATTPSADAGDGWGTLIALIAILWGVGGIWTACTKPKEYDVRLGGTIKQR